MVTVEALHTICDTRWADAGMTGNLYCHDHKVDVPDRAAICVGVDLKLLNLDGRYHIVEMSIASKDHDILISMRRVCPYTGKLEDGESFMSNLKHLNIDYVYE